MRLLKTRTKIKNIAKKKEYDDHQNEWRESPTDKKKVHSGFDERIKSDDNSKEEEKKTG